MFLKATIVWIVGLVTLVPYWTYYLLFHAARDQYAILIVGVLFWIFGYWGVVGPLLAALKVRSVFKMLEHAHVQGRLPEALRSRETRDLAIELIARENHMPRFLAGKVYRMLVDRLASGRGT